MECGTGVQLGGLGLSYTSVSWVHYFPPLETLVSWSVHGEFGWSSVGVFQLWRVMILQVLQEMPILCTNCFIFFFNHRFCYHILWPKVDPDHVLLCSFLVCGIRVGPRNRPNSQKCLHQWTSLLARHLWWFQNLKLLWGKEKDICYVFYCPIESPGIVGAYNTSTEWKRALNGPSNT